jgi:hypothetical protein
MAIVSIASPDREGAPWAGCWMSWGWRRRIARRQAGIDGPHWFVTPANPARLEAARQAAADARSKAQAYAAGVGVTLDDLICLVEPDTADRPPGLSRRVWAAAGSRDMPIDVEEYEVRATIDATFALTVGDDGRKRQQQPSPATAAP